MIAEDTELGKEETGKRVRGKSPDDAVQLISEGIDILNGFVPPTVPPTPANDIDRS